MPSVHAVIQAVEACASENEAAYIAFMAARLLQCRRVLKPTGSIYVHLRRHANSYLRMLLDAIFGASNFRNATWRGNGPEAGRTQDIGTSTYGHDYIFGARVRAPWIWPGKTYIKSGSLTILPYDDLTADRNLTRNGISGETMENRDTTRPSSDAIGRHCVRQERNNYARLDGSTTTGFPAISRNQST